MLTARDSIPDRVEGLDLGADDYSPNRAASTNSSPESGSGSATSSSTSKPDEPTSRRADGASIELTACGHEVPEFLFRHRDQVVSREQLLSHIWGYDFDPGSNVVDVYIRYLRKKLGNDLIQPCRIWATAFAPSQQAPMLGLPESEQASVPVPPTGPVLSSHSSLATML